MLLDYSLPPDAMLFAKDSGPHPGFQALPRALVIQLTSLKR